MDATADTSLFRFSTDALPEAHRVAYFREVYAQKLVKVEVESSPDRPCHFQGVIRTFRDLRLASTASSAMRFRRTRQTIAADGSDDLYLAIPLAGNVRAAQRNRDEIVAPGAAAFYQNAEPAFMELPSGSRLLSICVPSSAIAPMIARFDPARMSIFVAGGDSVRLLTRYVGMLLGDFPQASPEVARAATAHVHDLLALALGATADTAEVAKTRGVQAARLRAVKEDIIRDLGRHDLSVDVIAVSHRVSPRYLQMLFEGDGSTFTQFVLEQRLTRAHRMLTTPNLAQRSITSVAFDVGFNDLSYFNRTFRRRFGMTPTQLRGERTRPNDGEKE